MPPNPSRRTIAAFLNARSVAVIGASRRSDTIGALLVRNLVLGDYAGRVYDGLIRRGATGAAPH